MGVKMLKEVCQKDSHYSRMIKETSVVKEAVNMLGERRREKEEWRWN